MIVAKRVIVAELRKRGQNQRADFVNRQLPAEVDSTKHAGLLATLHIDLAELVAASLPPEAEQQS
jgi:hypothetical protein